MVDPVQLIPRALGQASGSAPLAYHTFQIHGFPTGFDYPRNATEIKLAHPQHLNNIEYSIAYALIEACVLGADVNGEREFFRFQKITWGMLFKILFPLPFLTVVY